MIDDEARKSVAALVTRKAGLNFPASQWGDLDRGIRKASEELQVKTKQFIQRLLEREADSKLFETLINHLTIGETYFFREKPILDIFTGNIIPELVKKRGPENKTINIWSAGCCSGEEPYTIAIILNEYIQDISEWKIKIQATDINKGFLDKANRGIYTAWSFRETPPDIRKKYFSSAGNSFTIRPEIRRMVTFSQFNLMDGNPGVHGIYPEHIDVIFCRNVLMYFAPENILKTYDLFHNVLVQDGWVLTSPVEVPVAAPAPFSRVRFGEMTLLQKTNNTQPSDKEHSSPFELKPQIKEGPGLRKPSLKILKPEKKKIAPVLKTKTIEPDTMYLAMRSFQKRSYGEVIRLLDKPVTSSRSADALLLMTKAFANLGKLNEALKLCSELLEQDAAKPLYFYLEASILLELREEGKAEEALRKALYLDNEMILAHYLMGNILRRKGHLNQANKHYRNILNIISDLPDESVLEESDGLTAGYMKETLKSLLKSA
ncbi:MAG: hypothetical protein NTW31_04650 [Bacteroidetes bacterium]|nr:hypothetical protein [Bacteroidota bacterium]